MKNALLINPWIYDFSAYNCWVRPVGLLRLAASLRRNDSEVAFFDCLDYRNQDGYGCSKFSKQEITKPELIKDIDRAYYRYGVKQNIFLDFLRNTKRPDEVYVGSGMTYWYPGVQEVIRLVRDVWGDINITLTGIYTVLCNQHARETSGADKVGIDNGYRCNKEYPAWDLIDSKGVVIIQTSYGCPFDCDYCGSKLLQKNFQQRDPDAVIAEIEHFFPDDVAFYDDALLVNAANHIKPILRKIIAKKIKCRWHIPNAVHARYLDAETARLMKEAGFVTIRLGLETSGDKRRDNKVNNEEFLGAIDCLKQSGFENDQIGIYTMFGSLDDSPEQVLKDIEFVTEKAKVPIKLSAYSLVPGSADCKRWVAAGKIPGDLDPLWHNNTIFPLLNKSYTLDKIRKLRRVAAAKNKELLGK